VERKFELIREHDSCSQDLCLVRKGFELDLRIKEEGKSAGLKAGVKYWTGAWEVDE
jgi:hypothetical protein